MNNLDGPAERFEESMRKSMAQDDVKVMKRGIIGIILVWAAIIGVWFISVLLSLGLTVVIIWAIIRLVLKFTR
jgi:hypothetical protein